MKSLYKKQVKYDSGTLIPHGEYLLMSFAKLDSSGLGQMTYEQYLECLSLLWKEIDKYYGQSDVCIPILGSGVTRLDDSSLSQQKLLDILIVSYKLSCHHLKHPCTLHIVCKKADDFSLKKIGSHIR